jgi:16S rRNA processing protein RimM
VTQSVKIPADLVLVGHVTGAFGVQGWIKIHPYSAEASALLHAKTWWLSKVADGIAVYDVEKLEAKIHGESVVARIMGIAGRDAAESLKGHVIEIQRGHFPVLDNNEFYWSDLIGLAVENLQGESLGVVADLIESGAHPILRVVGAANQDEALEREYLIPFVENFVPDVDQKNKKITVDWGLDY